MKEKKTGRFLAALAEGKAIAAALKVVGKNATQLPGRKAINLCPDFLGQIDKPRKTLGITGTNGKTTVSNLVGDVFSDMGVKFIDNRFGGNIDAGIASALMKEATIRGKMKKRYAVLEIDERMTTKIFPYYQPQLLVVTNLFRDSYRRNAHSEYIADILGMTIPKDTRLILNGEDLMSNHLCPDNPRVYFGIEDRSVFVGETDNIIQDMVACPECGTRLDYEYVRYNHIGKAKCPACGFGSPEKFDYAVTKADIPGRRLYIRSPKGEFDIKLLGDNVTDIYNTITAVAALMEFGAGKGRIKEAFEKMEIVKTRYNELDAGGKKLITIVAKGQNPIACSRVCDFVRKEQGKKAVVLLIDDFFDRKETSENIAWFFDTDFEFLNDPEIRQIVIGGHRQYDLRLRLKMAGIPEEKIAGCDEEPDTAELVKLSEVEKVFIFHDIYTSHYAEQVQKKLGSIAEGGRR